MSYTASTTGNHEAVRAFYADILSSPTTTTEDRYYELFSPDVVSIPTPPGGPGAQGMLNTICVPRPGGPGSDLGGAGDHLPGCGRFVVRGQASGTPTSAFFGVETPTGRSFSIMSIDILTLDEGKIAHVYHLEDWTSEIAQLTSAE